MCIVRMHSLIHSIAGVSLTTHKVTRHRTRWTEQPWHQSSRRPWRSSSRPSSLSSLPRRRRWRPSRAAGARQGSAAAGSGTAAPARTTAARGAIQSGPCDAPAAANNVSVPCVVTPTFFGALTAQAADGCEGEGFYTRDAFLAAAGYYPAFGRTGTVDDSKREIAAFFAHANLETIKFCYINEINGPSRNYCDPTSMQWPCQAGKGYYGRRPLQISWNYNYGPAGQSIGFDGVGDPDAVARSAVVAFRAALWYWMSSVHEAIVSGQGFGATIRAINGALTCDGKNPGGVGRRVGYYEQFCRQLGVDPGGNLTC